MSWSTSLNFAGQIGQIPARDKTAANMVATGVLCVVLVVAAGRVAADGDTVLQSFYSAPAQDNLVGASDATLAYASAQKYVSCNVRVCSVRLLC
jgi:hypothetical protein